jgi:hypothetical protein
VSCAVFSSCSDLVIGTDNCGIPCIKFTVPFDIKQNQGGLRRSKKVQQFDLHPTINIYWDPADTFFDGASILEADDVYRQAAFDNSQDKEKQEGRFFLQLKHCNVKGGKVWFLALLCMMVQFLLSVHCHCTAAKDCLWCVRRAATAAF